MTYLIVDDEAIILQGMEMSVREAVEADDIIITAQDPYEALDIVKTNHIDVIFCDVDMPGMNGLQLVKKIQEIADNIDVIFATGYAHYSLDAWNTTAQAFILKPVDDDDVRRVLDKVKRKHERNARKLREEWDAKREAEGVTTVASGELSESKPIIAMCFGNFEIYYLGKPIHFARKKSREMLAYLIDRRGAMITSDEIRSILWEEEEDSEEKRGYVRVLANDIRKAFDAIGIDSILINEQKSYAVNISAISCDYIDFMEGKEEARKQFQDEYMVQYSWAEPTLARLMNMV